jgi:hypothetical protein
MMPEALQNKCNILGYNIAKNRCFYRIYKNDEFVVNIRGYKRFYNFIYSKFIQYNKNELLLN